MDEFLFQRGLVGAVASGVAAVAAVVLREVGEGVDGGLFESAPPVDVPLGRFEAGVPE